MSYDVLNFRKKLYLQYFQPDRLTGLVQHRAIPFHQMSNGVLCDRVVKMILSSPYSQFCNERDAHICEYVHIKSVN